MAISHGIWQAHHQDLFFLPPLITCSGTCNQSGSPTVSIEDTEAPADTMDHPQASHQMRIYNAENICHQRIQISHTAPHNPWRIIDKEIMKISSTFAEQGNETPFFTLLSKPISMVKTQFNDLI